VRDHFDEALGDQDATTSSSPVPTVPSAAPVPVEPPQVAQAPQGQGAPDAEEAAEAGGERESVGHRAGLHKVKGELALSASAAMVIDQDTGQVLLHKNGDAVLPIASLTKMMTALVLTESKLPMHEIIKITDDDVDVERHSRSRLKVGTTLSRSQALQLALMSSENRAAHALGRTYPAGIVAFVQAMNAKAAALGMKNTKYVDPTGLATGNQSTAQDLALLAATAARNPLLAEYSTTRQHEVQLANGRTLQFHNSNRLVKNPKWDILLQKTGYIVEAGWCMLLDTKIGGHNMLVVLLDAGGASPRVLDAERIRHWVGAQFGVTESQPALVATHHPARVRRQFKH
jgi:D-alanyl-D-alanine endopeptidase (penicillin-binding protein 7)